MKLRGCNDSHFIWSIQDGEVKKVFNTDSRGRPNLKFKKLEDIYQLRNAESTPLSFAERNTTAGNGYAVEEDELDGEDLTLLQIKKTCKRKKRKASEALLLTPKVEDDDCDLCEPLFKFRVKVLKSSKTKKKPVNGSLRTSELSKDFATVSVKVEALEMDDFECRETSHMADVPFVCDGSVRFIASETGFVLINPVPECTESGSEVSLDSLENMEVDNEEDTTNGLLPLSVLEVENEDITANRFLPLSASEVNNENLLSDGHLPLSVSDVENEVITEKGLLPSLISEVENEDIKDNCLLPLSVSEVENEDLKSYGLLTLSVSDVENEEITENGLLPSSISVVENEDVTENGLLPLSVSEVENEVYVEQCPSFLSSMKDDSSLEDCTASTSDCSQSQQTPEEVNHVSSGQESDSRGDEGLLRNQEDCSPCLVSDSLTLPRSHSWLSPDDHVDDVVPMEAKLSESEEKQHLTIENTVADSNSMNSDHIVFVTANTDSEVKLDHNYQTDIKSEKTSEIENSCCIETRQPERLPLTRKAISPSSQKKLCQAMEAAELRDDMDHYKCKEKLYFEEQAENKCSSTKLNVEDNELNVDPQQGPQLIRNKVGFSSKHVLRRAKTFKKGSPPKKGCLDGPRLCRSLPRLSTGFTSIQGCLESAIAFSQRQMHDIETLASKLMSELDSMKTLVEEKMLFEAYRSSSLKNDADEVKSAIKSATKTEEAAKRWLSMMTRDCNRFCKIMKLNEDVDTSASADPALGNTIYEKPLQRERKKISFADEAGGTLCDIKVFQIDRDSLEQL